MRSDPYSWPSTRPRTTTSRAVISAFTTAFGPTVTTELLSVIFPSTFPSMNRSSVPVNSPLILIPWLTQPIAFEAFCVPPNASFWLFVIGPTPSVGFEGLAEFSEGDCASSFRHIEYTSRSLLLFKVALLGWSGCRDSETLRYYSTYIL